jgi:hypothetical protein
MKVRNGRVVRKGRNELVKTIVRGVRADSELWELCDLVADRKDISRNELILLAIYEYCTSSEKEIESEK